jgi:hypothetical protein
VLNNIYQFYISNQELRRLVNEFLIKKSRETQSGRALIPIPIAHIVLDSLYKEYGAEGIITFLLQYEESEVLINKSNDCFLARKLDDLLQKLSTEEIENILQKALLLQYNFEGTLYLLRQLRDSLAERLVQEPERIEQFIKSAAKQLHVNEDNVITNIISLHMTSAPHVFFYVAVKYLLPLYKRDIPKSSNTAALLTGYMRFIIRNHSSFDIYEELKSGFNIMLKIRGVGITSIKTMLEEALIMEDEKFASEIHKLRDKSVNSVNKIAAVAQSIIEHHYRQKYVDSNDEIIV